MNFKIISIFFILSTLFSLGCIGQNPVGTPQPTQTAIPTAMPTIMPTIVPTAPTPTSTPIPTQARTQKLYTSDVDDRYGFYKVTTYNASSNYTNKTITINAGDTIKWVSVTDSGYSLTIVSKEGLWDNSSSRMRYKYHSFNYSFNKSGNYEVYLKEFPKVAPQKIIVNP